jgi:hypothetical protein
MEPNPANFAMQCQLGSIARLRSSVAGHWLPAGKLAFFLLFAAFH